jgi:hypothetical protein
MRRDLDGGDIQQSEQAVRAIWLIAWMKVMRDGTGTSCSIRPIVPRIVCLYLVPGYGWNRPSRCQPLRLSASRDGGE